MLDALKALFSSKKFLMAIIGSVCVTVLVKVLPVLGIAPEMAMQVVTYVAGFFGVGIGGIGLADLGKEKAKIEAPKE